MFHTANIELSTVWITRTIFSLAYRIFEINENVSVGFRVGLCDEWFAYMRES